VGGQMGLVRNGNYRQTCQGERHVPDVQRLGPAAWN